ncbi:hypothetical protein QQX98_009634 [Neonectria punicea]|uniref:Uncharacterized protein n=1 Tax=Neonectria punicea TaxID=979145 RepID=A0ABR1GRU2_9HYPO
MSPWAPISKGCHFPSCPAVYRALLPNTRNHPESILVSLSRPNPTIRKFCQVEKPIYGPGRVPVAQNSISRWHDFNFANIRSAFSDVLDQPSSGGQGDYFDSYEVMGLSDLKAFFPNYLSGLFNGSIPQGTRLLQQRSGIDTPQVGMRCDLDFRSLAGDLVPYKPNIHFCARDRLQTSLVFGCVRLSGAWHSSYLHAPRSRLTASAVQPIQQLATYASVGNTRYGVILTDKEAVVVRFHRDNSNYGAEWQAIPWDACGSGVLTMRLAIWSLVMMSLNKEHRSIRSRRDTLPLDLLYKLRA